MLRLVHPAREGQDPPTHRKGRHAPALSLTAEEVRHLRAAARNAVRAYGSTSALAEVVGVPKKTIINVTGEKGTRPSPALALAIARASGMSLEAVIGGKLSAAGRCQACGSRVGERRAAS